MGRPYRFGDGFDVSAVCRTVVADYVDNSDGTYDVTADFEPAQGGLPPPKEVDIEGNEQTNPLLWRDEIEVSTTQLSAPVYRAIFRGFMPPGISDPAFPPDAVMVPQASNLQPFDPGIEDPIHIKVIRITKNLGVYDEVEANWVGAVNSAPFTISKPAYLFRHSVGQYNGLITQFGATFNISNKIKYYKKTLEVQHINRPGGWRHVVADQGNYEIYRPEEKRPNGSTISNSDLPPERKHERHAPKDEDGVPAIGPFPLNGHGKLLKPGEDPVWLIYSSEHKPERDFSAISW